MGPFMGFPYLSHQRAVMVQFQARMHIVLDIDDFFFLFDLILYVPSTIFQLNRDRSSWVEPVLS